MSGNKQDFKIDDIEILTQGLSNLLPSGIAFNAKNIKESKLRLLLKSLSKEALRCTGDIYSLANEFIPNFDNSFIDIWERFVGIPDKCIPISRTDEERRINILIKLAYLNLEAEQDYYDLANLLNVELLNIDNSVFGRMGFEINDLGTNSFPLLFDPALNPIVGAFLFGGQGVSIFKCLVRNYSPAHTYVTFKNITTTFDFDFTSSEIIPDQISFSRNSIATAINQLKQIKYYNNDELRFNYDLDTGLNNGILIEGDFTNIITYSNSLSNWDLNNITISQNSINSPLIDSDSNILLADVVTKNGGGGGRRLELITTISSGQDYQLKLLAKNIDINGNLSIDFEGDTTVLYNWDNGLFTIDNGSPTNLNVDTYTDNWKMLSFDFSATNKDILEIFPSIDGVNTAGKQISIYGVNITDQLNAISILPSNNGTTSTKERDIISLNTDSLFGVDEGMILIEHDVISGSPLLDGILESYGAGKTLITWDATESRIYSNGSLISTQATINPNGIIELFSNTTTSALSFGHLKRIKTFNVVISDADAIIETT